MKEKFDSQRKIRNKQIIQKRKKRYKRIHFGMQAGNAKNQRIVYMKR